MISTNDFKPGLTIELDGQVYQVVSSQHHKPGKGQAVVRTRLRDVQTDSVFNKTFRAGEKVPRAHVDRDRMQFLYHQGDRYFFMDNETYEQFEYTREQLGENAKWLKEGETVEITRYQGKLLDIEPPQTVEREIIRTDPGIRGNTAQGGTKPAVIEGDITVDVPLFVNQGEVIRVDTRSGEYLERAES